MMSIMLMLIDGPGTSVKHRLIPDFLNKAAFSQKLKNPSISKYTKDSYFLLEP